MSVKTPCIHKHFHSCDPASAPCRPSRDREVSRPALPGVHSRLGLPRSPAPLPTPLLLALLPALLLALPSAGCGDDSSVEPDAAVDARVRPDVSTVEPDPAFDEEFTGYGPEETVTTLLQTRRSRYPEDTSLVDRWERPRIPAQELGKRYPQPGEPHLLRDELGAGGTGSGARRSLLYFVHLTDAQLIDNQSPAYVPSNKYTVLGDSLPAFHQHGAVVLHLLDSAVQTANQFGLARPFDFFIHTGDAIEDTQQNELEWFMALLDGGEVHPDSGEPDDPVPGPDNDAWDPFLAQGLPSGVPWYALTGNHDLSVNGNFPVGLIQEANQEPTASEIAALLDDFDATLPGVGTADQAPNVLPAAELPAFTVDPEAFDPQDLWGEADIRALSAGPVPPDEDRAFVGSCGFIDAHFSTGTEPVGHGFTQASRQSCVGNYVVEAVAGLPLRLIALDTGPHVGGAGGVLTPPLNPDGTVNEALAGDPAHDQIAWLIAELDRALADGVVVLVASHHSSGSITSGNLFAEMFEIFFPDEEELGALWRQYFIQPVESMDGGDLRALLTEYPNVVMHLVGHSHENRVNAVCPDGSLVTGPEALDEVACAPPPADRSAAHGYWEVMAASIRDYPNQFRITELVDNGDGTGSIYSTVVDCQGGAGSLYELGAFLALANAQFNGREMAQDQGSVADRNVELRFSWATEVLTAVSSADGATPLESVTTLAEPAPGLPVLPQWP